MLKQIRFTIAGMEGSPVFTGFRDDGREAPRFEKLEMVRVLDTLHRTGKIRRWKFAEASSFLTKKAGFAVWTHHDGIIVITVETDHALALYAAWPWEFSEAPSSEVLP